MSLSRVFDKWISKSRVKVEFQSGYLYSQFSLWLVKTGIPKSWVKVKFIHSDFTQLISGFQQWSLSRVKVEFWSGYLNSQFSPWLGENWDSKSRVYAPRFHTVGDWNSKVELKSNLSRSLKWSLEQLVDIYLYHPLLFPMGSFTLFLELYK